MPKERRQKKFEVGDGGTRHAPLGQVMDDDDRRRKFARPSPSSRRNKTDDDADAGSDGDGETPMLDERTSGRILDMARGQRIEMEREEMVMAEEEGRRRRGLRRGKEDDVVAGGQAQNHPAGRRDRHDVGSSDDEEGEGDEEDDYDEEGESEEETRIYHDAGYVSVDGPGLSAEEEAVVASMMGGTNGAEERRTLADIILDKIQQKEAEQAAKGPSASGPVGGNDDGGGMEEELPPKVVEVYTDIGKILSRYTSGKLPKAFKVIPSLSNWEEVLYLTRPDLWTPQAMFAATRIFASNLNPKMAQRFYYLVLLDAVRADIEYNKKLNYHYYMSLKKSLYKPAAFFKGILLPLCRENCTLREAAIVSSVLQRVSIPVHHSAVAIHKLAQLDYSGAASIFIKTLLNKKYSLPAPVIGSLVRHFAAFADDARVLPVLWHQSLLVFVQRYKNELREEARDSLRLVMKAHFHPKITPEIRRELYGSQAWKEERVAAVVVAHQGATAMET